MLIISFIFSLKLSPAANQFSFRYQFIFFTGMPILLDQFNNFITKRMGAGCMGPNRRSTNYQVNRLTENSPIKNRVSISELPMNSNKDRIIDQLNLKKTQYEQKNLISTLLQSPIMPSSIQKGFPSKMGRSSLQQSPQVYLPNNTYSPNIDNPTNSGMIRLKRIQSNTYLDQNKYDNKYIPDHNLYISQFRTTNQPYIVENDRVLQSLSSNKASSQLKLNTRSESFSVYKKRPLSNIPQITDEQSKTPHYVREIRIKNGQDVKRTDLFHIPKEIEAVPRIDLFKYLKDLY